MLKLDWTENFLLIFQGEEITSNGALPDGKDAMSIFNSGPKSGGDEQYHHEFYFMSIFALLL